MTWLSIARNAIAAGCAIGLAFACISLREGVVALLRDRSGDLTIRLVMRAGVDKKKADAVAAKLREQTSGLNVTVIGEAEGRSLLALQEPWMARLPDMEIAPLPVLLEIEHPELLSAPERVIEFNSKLANLPDADFVVFNEATHDRLVRLVSSILSTSTILVSAFLCGVGLLLALVFFLAGKESFSTASTVNAATAAISVGAGWALAGIIFSAWRPQSAGGFAMPPVSLFQQALVASAAWVMTAAASIVGSRIKHRTSPKP